MRRLAKNLATICADLLARSTPHLSQPLPADNALSAVPILAELESYLVDSGNLYWIASA